MTEIKINLNDIRDENNKIFVDLIDPNKWDEFKEEIKTNGGDTNAAIKKVFLRGMY